MAKKPQVAKEVKTSAEKALPITDSNALKGTAAESPAPGSQSVDEDGNTVTHNPVPVREKTKQEQQSEAALAKVAAKAEKQKAIADKKATALAAKEAKAVERAAGAADREATKAERAARLAELGKNYQGSMLALADRVKQGAYVVGATGQFRSNDDFAQALDEVPVDNVIRLGKLVFGIDENPYIHLNTGQQSMNFRNRMRGAIKKGLKIGEQVITLDYIKGLIESEGFAVKGIAEEKAAKKAAKAERVAKAKEDKAAKAQTKADAAAKAAESKAE